MTAAQAQVALRAIAFDFVRLEERCQEVLDSLPWSENEVAMFEGRIPWDLATELRTTVESCWRQRSARPRISGTSPPEDQAETP